MHGGGGATRTAPTTRPVGHAAQHDGWYPLGLEGIQGCSAEACCQSYVWRITICLQRGLLKYKILLEADIPVALRGGLAKENRPVWAGRAADAIGGENGVLSP